MIATYPRHRVLPMFTIAAVMSSITPFASAQQPPSTPPATSQPAASDAPELTSLLGRPLYAAAVGSRPKQEAQLDEARRDLASNPGDIHHTIWLGRRQAYVWRMQAAIGTFTSGLVVHPDHAALLRHRGHRYISIRNLDAAIADLELATRTMGPQADEMEPDGQPNKLNEPLTTLGFNVWYHLGLARYLKGDYAAALAAYDECLKFSQKHADNRVATSYWMYLTLRRLNRDADAARLAAEIPATLEIVENAAYHRLLLLFNGTHTVEAVLAAEQSAPTDAATIGYGVGLWRLLSGDRPGATQLFETVTAGENWPAFGFIAAEVELKRLRDGHAPPPP